MYKFLFVHPLCLRPLFSSWSQDKAHDPRSEEMGTAPSNQWCQQGDVKQLHIGVDGVALPPESVHNTHSHGPLSSLLLFRLTVSLILYLLFSLQLLKNQSSHLYRGTTQ